MRHIGLYIGFVIVMVVMSCSQKKTDATPLEDTTLVESGVGNEELGDADGDSVGVGNDSQETASQAKPIEDNRSFYQRGYDEGYDNGKEDGVMDLGDGYSYCDANPYMGAAKRDYERGYERGYKKGYNEGFYEYSDGDEEVYDEY